MAGSKLSPTDTLIVWCVCVHLQNIPSSLPLLFGMSPTTQRSIERYLYSTPQVHTRYRITKRRNVRNTNAHRFLRYSSFGAFPRKPRWKSNRVQIRWICNRLIWPIKCPISDALSGIVASAEVIALRSLLRCDDKTQPSLYVTIRKIACDTTSAMHGRSNSTRSFFRIASGMKYNRASGKVGGQRNRCSGYRKFKYPSPTAHSVILANICQGVVLHGCSTSAPGTASNLPCAAPDFIRKSISSPPPLRGKRLSNVTFECLSITFALTVQGIGCRCPKSFSSHLQHPQLHCTGECYWCVSLHRHGGAFRRGTDRLLD